MYSKLLKQASLLLGGNLTHTALNFVAIIILAKFLDFKELGSFVLMQSYILVAAALFTPHSWQGFIKFIASNESKLPQLLRETISLDFLAASVGFVISFFLVPIYLEVVGIGSEHKVTLQVMTAFVLFNQTGAALGLLRYFEQIKLIVLQQVVSSVVFITCVIVGVVSKFELAYFALASAVSLLLGVLVINVLAVKYASGKVRFASLLIPNDFEKKKELRKFNLYAYATSLVDIPVKLLDVILVGALVTVESSAVYKIIKQLGTITTKFTAPINQVLYPELNKALAKKNFARVKGILLNFSVILAAVAIPSSLLLGLTSDFWVPIVFSNELLAFNNVLFFYLIVHSIAVSFLAIHPTFLALGYVKRLLIVTFSANMIFVIAVFSLTPSMGLMGVVVAISLQYAITIVSKIIPIHLYLQKTANEKH